MTWEFEDASAVLPYGDTVYVTYRRADITSPAIVAVDAAGGTERWRTDALESNPYRPYSFGSPDGGKTLLAVTRRTACLVTFDTYDTLWARRSNEGDRVGDSTPCRLHATPIEVRAIRESAESSLTAATMNDVDTFAKADAAFHDSVGAASHNVFLRASVAGVRRLASQSDVLLFHGDVPGSLEVAAHQHMAIAEAVAAGSADLAERLMVEHIATTQSQFESKIRDRLFSPGAHAAAEGPPGPSGPSGSGSAGAPPPSA